ncbi:hypothetical protein [Streptomyces sp. NRRL WC-3742]|uniref:hypothetical protein n=1 Tax=Streptomyces sp. NRRL WC-3742 TaxID=1463934 RepID=UPI00131B4848|nr:hypothetical protein [Streptomyces sp. NRRL WC-3742]
MPQSADASLRDHRAAALARMRAMVTEGRIDFSTIGYPDDTGEAAQAASPAVPTDPQA